MSQCSLPTQRLSKEPNSYHDFGESNQQSTKLKTNDNQCPFDGPEGSR